LHESKSPTSFLVLLVSFGNYKFFIIIGHLNSGYKETFMNTSKHFEVRQSQRAISDLVVKLILDGGVIIDEQLGGVRVIELSSSDRKRIGKRIKSLARQWDHVSNVVIVEGHGALITAYHKH